jgi:DNA-binding beta-propeller fold protein YncE
VFEFNQEAKLQTDWPIPASLLAYGIAVDAQDNVYLLAGGGVCVVEVDSAGARVGKITEPGEEGHQINIYGVAVDPATNDLYVLDRPGGYTRGACSCSAMNLCVVPRL